MAVVTYGDAITRVLKHEGGYVNHPSDPGGPTNFGITLGTYRQYVNPKATAADIKAMSLDSAKRIYKVRYWDAQRGDNLPAGVDYAMFDYGVNSGIGRSGKVLRALLGLPANAPWDTVVAAAHKRSPAQLVTAICDERIGFLRRLKTWGTFGKGWQRRVDEVRAVAGRMVNAKPTDNFPSTPAPGKAEVKKPGAGTAAGGGAGTGGAVATGTYLGLSPEHLIMLGVAAAVIAAGVFIYLRIRAQEKQEDVSHIIPVPEAAP